MSCSTSVGAPLVCTLPGSHPGAIDPSHLDFTATTPVWGWERLLSTAGAIVRDSPLGAIPPAVYAFVCLAVVVTATSAALLAWRRRARRSVLGEAAASSPRRSPLRRRLALSASLAAGALVVVLGAAMPASADTNLTVTKEPITIGTIAVTSNGQPVAPDSTLMIVPGSVMSVSAPVRNDGPVPISLSLSTVSLLDLKGLGSVTTWKVATPSLPKISGTLGGGGEPQLLTTVQPGQSLTLVVQIQAPTSLDNHYQKTSMRFRLVLTETEVG